jgi:hypothetical protein
MEVYMLGKLNRSLGPLAAASLAVLAAPAVSAAAAPAVPAVASPVQDPLPIGHDQYFSGYVNNHPPGQAVILTNCIGPIRLGETGNPLPNQPVEVKPVVATGTTDVGYTGSAANSINALLGTPVGAVVVIAAFTGYYEIRYIPTTIRVPCSGSGTVIFAPSPGSVTARPATLAVTFVGQP